MRTHLARRPGRTLLLALRLATATVLHGAAVAVAALLRLAVRVAAPLLHVLRWAGSALAELHRLNRLLGVVRLSPDRYLAHPDKPPDTYAEFLARTSSPMLHEPSARARLAGRAVS
jgi:hypothetical protein